jgi:hypothetical protein
MERYSIGPLEHGRRDLSRRGESRVENEGRHESCFCLGQRLEADLLRDPLGNESCSPAPKPRTRRNFLCSEIAGQEDLPVA